MTDGMTDHLDDPFEARLDQLFAEVPEAPDADAFHAAVMHRLERPSRLRRWALAGASLGGAAIATVSAASFVPQVFQAGADARTEAQGLYHQALVAEPVLQSLGGAQVLLWAGLALVALAVSATPALVRRIGAEI
jgi:hypothetical protein